MPAEPATPTLPHLANLIRDKKPVTIVLYGDSISEVGRSDTWHGGASSPATNYGPVLAEMLAQAYPGVDFSVRHFGIGGQNTFEGLGRIDWLAELKPDLTIVAFGANDCGYKFLTPDATGQALRFLIDGARSRTGSDVVVMGTGGDDPQKPTFRHLNETLAATRLAAQSQNAPYVDVRHAILAATENGHAWDKYHVQAGNCHPNDAGHRVWAKTAFDVIKASLDATPAEDHADGAHTD